MVKVEPGVPSPQGGRYSEEFSSSPRLVMLPVDEADSGSGGKRPFFVKKNKSVKLAAED